MAVYALKHYKDTLDKALNASSWTLVEIVGECFFYVPPAHCPLRGTPSRAQQILLAKLSGDSEPVFCLLGLSLAWKLSSSRICFFALDRASPLCWLKMGGNRKKYQKPAKVSSLTNTHSSPAITFWASFWAFFFAKSSLIFSSDSLSEGCPEITIEASEASVNGTRPSFWSMYCAISKIFSANATGTRTIFSGLCFQQRGLPAPGLAPPCPLLLFALLFFMFYLKDVTISIMAVFYSP